VIRDEAATTPYRTYVQHGRASSQESASVGPRLRQLAARRIPPQRQSALDSFPPPPPTENFCRSYSRNASPPAPIDTTYWTGNHSQTEWRPKLLPARAQPIRHRGSCARCARTEIRSPPYFHSYASRHRLGERGEGATLCPAEALVLPLRCPALRDPRSQTPGRWPGVWESSPQVTIPKVTCGSIGRLGSTHPEPCSSHVGECGFSRPLAMAGKPGPLPYLRRRIRPRLHGSSATHAIYRNGTALASRSWGSPSLQLQIFPFPYSSSKSSVVCCLPFSLRVVYLAPFVFIRYCVLAALYDASRRIELFSASGPRFCSFMIYY
jgi:hypothetical protein